MGMGYIGSTSNKSSCTSGADGKSAYEVAVENGFTGTEKEWLESLKGKDGKSAYQIALENGFIGTEKEWLESLQGYEKKSYKIEFDVDLNTGTLYQHIYEECEYVK